MSLAQPTYKDGWDIPGGYVEPGEIPAAAAARELREELWLDRPVGQLLLVDWRRNLTPARLAGRLHLAVAAHGRQGDVVRGAWHRPRQ